MTVLVAVGGLLALVATMAQASDYEEVHKPKHVGISWAYTSLDLALPKGMDFAQYGIEPNNPKGQVMLLGGLLYQPIGRNFVLGYELDFPIYDDDFRQGFTDRQGWPAPGEGEAYTYSRVSKIGLVHSILLTYLADNKRAKEGFQIGLKASLINLTVEQGYDRYNTRQPYRSAGGDGLAWTGLLGWGSNDFSVNLVLGPYGSLDFGDFGSGDLSGVGLEVQGRF